jgi:hypothetical protein
MDRGQPWTGCTWDHFGSLVWTDVGGEPELAWLAYEHSGGTGE